MDKYLECNSDGSIDVLDGYGNSLYRVEKGETGIVALLVRQLLEYENAFDKEHIRDVLNSYFEVGNSYVYNLIRDKEAFSVGTMTLEDFEEFDEESTDDIAEYLMKNMM